MNRLLNISFKKLGYDYDFLTNIHKNLYDGGFLFEDEGKIVLALKQIRSDGGRIVILPDFDIDGISAGCVLYGGLSLLGFNVVLFDPNTTSGYGIGFADIDRIASLYPDAQAILTCDVGIGARDETVYAQSKEMWVYVTDHHIEKPGRRTADAAMDPSRNDSPLAFKGVCGAWVAWHLVRTFAMLEGDAEKLRLVDKLLLFVGLGSCGDMMPMIHDTRDAVKRSVEEFNALLDSEDMADYFGTDPDSLPDAYAAPFENLRKFHFWLIGEGKVRPGNVTDETYSFNYCPLFNSLKRMGGEMARLYEMLYVRYEWNSERRLELFSWLRDLNEERKALTAQLYGQLYGDPRQALAPYIYLVDAPAGILGLLANKIMERTGRPCMVMRPDAGRDGFAGSGRTPGWMDSGSAFDMDGIKKDGHEHSFGIFCLAAKLKDLWASLDAQYLSEQKRIASEGTAGTDPRPVVVLNGHDCYGTDYDFSVNSVDDYDVCMGYAHDIQKFRPFGDGFREPEFVLAFTNKDVQGWRTMGSDKTHLRISLDHNIGAVWFGGASFADRLASMADSEVLRLSGTFGINEFNGSVSLQFMVSGEA